MGFDLCFVLLSYNNNVLIQRDNKFDKNNSMDLFLIS